jgi:hypothetical protein
MNCSKVGTVQDDGRRVLCDPCRAKQRTGAPRMRRGPEVDLPAPRFDPAIPIIDASDPTLEQQARSAADPGPGDGSGPAALGTRLGRDRRDESRDRASTNLRPGRTPAKGDRS